ncbi:MAG: dipeptidase [Candidatus Bathyarchaeota archaeon]|nr:dipeptidase [Candidatus Bathyarchaeota archaeon]
MSRSYMDLSKDEQDHAMTLYKEAIVIDASIVPFIHYVGEDIWLEDSLKGGVTASNGTVCMQHNFGEALRDLTEYNEWAEKKKDKALIVRSTEDIHKVKKEGKHGLILGPQNSDFLEGKLAYLDIAHQMGIRIIQIGYSTRNLAADGCVEESNAGLSNYGKALVEAMNRKGILIDLSHVGDLSTMETIEHSRDPVSFTHVCPRESTPRDLSPYAQWAGGERFIKFAVQRGRTDQALKACTERGGIVGVTPFFAKKAGDSTLTDDLMDQIDYTVDLVGADKVAFGSDLDFRNGVTRAAYIWKHPDRIDNDYHTPMDKTWGYGWLENMPNLAKGLVARGYSDQETKGVLGGNWMPLFKQVWGK